MIEFKNLKDKPDSEGFWWITIGDGNWEPVSVIKRGNVVYIGEFGCDEYFPLIRFSKLSQWLSNDERDRQLFEMGARAQMEKTKGGSCGHPIVTWREFNFGALGIKENKEG